MESGDRIDGKPHEDFVGYDGKVSIGRIYLDLQTLRAGNWYWAIQYPKGGRPYHSNSGWEPTAAEAAKRVEGCWDIQIERVKNDRRKPNEPARG